MNNKSLYSLSDNSAGNNDYKKVAAWFLGSKGENGDLFSRLVQKSITEHVQLRKEYYQDEEAYITEDVKQSEEYKSMVENLEHFRWELSESLKNSVPFFSQRYQAHMNGDTLMAAKLGYITAMLYNQNNVATEASPVTSKLEKEAAFDLCSMLGYGTEKSWGHITADGTIANIESMWAARNLKAYSLAIKEALLNENCLEKARDKIQVSVYDSGQISKKKLIDCDEWQLLNINIEDALNIPKAISEICMEFKSNDPKESQLWDIDSILKPYLLATKGIAYYAGKYQLLSKMKIIVPATHHYSWPKSATLLGIGQENVIGIPVDEYCRMDTGILKETLKEFSEKQIPVIMVVAVIGSTAEGTVDDIYSINEMREEFAQKGLQFHLHCDAAWGGYLCSMLIEEKPKDFARKAAHFVPSVPLSDYAIRQFKSIKFADTITIDPHKAGYIPYAAGALCYRNGLLRYLITFNAAYIHSSADVNMGIYGVEGSKPGASAAAVWLTHRTIPLNRSGYGQILGECNYSAKLYYCYWITLTGSLNLKDNKGDEYSFSVLPLIQLPESIVSEINPEYSFTNRSEMMQYIKNNIIGKSAETIAKNPRSMFLLSNIGADVLMNTFVVNFYKNGTANTNLELMNQLNDKLFQYFSIIADNPERSKEVKYILMMNTLSFSEYGEAFHHIKETWNLDTGSMYSLNILVNTILQPWPNTPEFIGNVMELFKQGVENALSDIL